MTISTTDASAHRDYKITNAAKVIGKSRDRLNAFIAIYSGKTRIKTADYIRSRSGLKTTKRVLEEGKKLSVEEIVNQVKDSSGLTAYEKIPFYAKNRNAIVSKVREINLKKQIKNSSHINNKSVKSTSVKKSNIIRVKRTKYSNRNIKKLNKTWDVFVSHASEDKSKVAKPLAIKLRKKGLKVWYDEFELDWGSKLLESIDRGLKNSLFGIVILSHSFFRKDWAKKELAGFHSLSMSKNKNNILPLLYGITHDELINYSPILSDIIYKRWDEGIDSITDAVKRLVNKNKSAI